MKAIKTIALVLLALLAGYVGSRITGPVATATQDETAYQRIMRTGTMRCGYFVWPPYIVKDVNTGALSGALYDYVQALGVALNITIEWTQEMNFATYLQDINSGKYDAECGGGFATPERGKIAAYTNPIGYVPEHVYVRSDDARALDYETLNKPDITFVALDGDSSFYTTKRVFNAAQLRSLPQNAAYSDLFLEVQGGKADALITDAPTGAFYMQNNPGKVRILQLPRFPNLIALNITVPMTDVALKNMLNTAQQTLEASGTTARILRQYDADKQLFLLPSHVYKAE